MLRICLLYFCVPLQIKYLTFNKEKHDNKKFIKSLYDKIRLTFRVKENFFDACGCVKLNNMDWTIASLNSGFYGGTSGILFTLTVRADSSLKNLKISMS